MITDYFWNDEDRNGRFAGSQQVSLQQTYRPCTQNMDGLHLNCKLTT